MDKVRHLLESPQLRHFNCKTSFETGHKDAVNDAKLDYFSTRLATASSDKSVCVYSVDNVSGAYHRLAELTGYEGPVWEVSWSHPKFGSMLASASYDGRVIVWKEVEDEESSLKSRWYAVFDEQLHKVSVNSVAWASVDCGALLAAGSSDGSISVLSLSEDEDRWSIKRLLKAHELGCQTVSWSHKSKRFASGGNDNCVKIWSLHEGQKHWTLESTLNGHSDWVFCVDWSPVDETIVSAGRDGRVLVWSRVEEPEKPKWNHSSSFSNSSLNHSALSFPQDEWTSRVIQIFDKSNTFHVSWEPMGNFLCVTGGDEEVFIWKKCTRDRWMCIGKPNIGVNPSSSQKFTNVKLD